MKNTGIRRLGVLCILSAILCAIGLIGVSRAAVVVEEEIRNRRCGQGYVIGILRTYEETATYEETPGMPADVATLVAYIDCEDLLVEARRDDQTLHIRQAQDQDREQLEWIWGACFVVLPVDHDDTIDDLAGLFFQFPAEEPNEKDLLACTVPPLPSHEACDMTRRNICDKPPQCRPGADCFLFEPWQPNCLGIKP